MSFDELDAAKGSSAKVWPMGVLSEADSKALLARFGIPVVEERLVASPEEAVAVAPELGDAVALKLCGPGIAHKTERALVRLNVQGPAQVGVAARELLDAAEPGDGEVKVLVARMVRGTRELIAGLTRDPQLGMTVMLGVGGVLAEAVADVAFRLVPLQPVDAEEMIDDLVTQRIFEPFRGEPAVDRARLVDVLVGLSRAAEEHPEIVSADLNPLIVTDGVPVAVDALVEVA